MPKDDRLIQMTASSYKKRIAVASLIGALFGGGTIWLLDEIRTSDDEDRPPIIVKNGSLIFESGDDAQNPGYDWDEPNAKDEWHPKHAKGKPTRVYQAIFVGGTGNGCAPRYTTKAVIYYKGDDETQPRQYTLDIRQRGSKKGPAVVGSGLTADNTGHAKRLTLPVTGKITRVALDDDLECADPTWIMLRPLK